MSGEPKVTILVLKLEAGGNVRVWTECKIVDEVDEVDFVDGVDGVDSGV